MTTTDADEVIALLEAAKDDWRSKHHVPVAYVIGATTAFDEAIDIIRSLTDRKE